MPAPPRASAPRAAAPRLRWIGVALAGCAAAGGLGWLLLRGPAQRDREPAPAAPEDRGPLRAGELPPEVRDAIAGRPVTAHPLPGEAEGVGIRPLPGDAGAAEPRPPVGAPPALGGGAPAGAAAGSPAGSAPDQGAGDAPPPAPAEAERRAGWRARQVERDALRVEVLAAELGLDAARREAVAAAFAAALAERVAVYEGLDPEAPDRRALSAALDGVRARLADALAGPLGAEGFAAYQRMEADGRFALPSEQRAPPPR